MKGDDVYTKWKIKVIALAKISYIQTLCLLLLGGEKTMAEKLMYNPNNDKTNLSVDE